jgi:hypothetical protein
MEIKLICGSGLVLVVAVVMGKAECSSVRVIKAKKNKGAQMLVIKAKKNKGAQMLVIKGMPTTDSLLAAGPSRQMQLKLANDLVAESQRCLGCRHADGGAGGSGVPRDASVPPLIGL